MEQKDNNEFLIEKIKDRPINKKKLLRRTIFTIAMAIVFGLVACFTFLVLQPVINKVLYPPKEAKIIIFPEEEEEMSPEEMLADNMQAEKEITESQEEENVQEESSVSVETVQDLINSRRADKSDYADTFKSLSEYVAELSKSIVTVTGSSLDYDLFENALENENKCSGLIVADNGIEFLILCDQDVVRNSEIISVTFNKKVQLEATIKSFDDITGLVVLGVDKELIPEYFMDEIIVAKLGQSTAGVSPGMPVIALGSPMGIVDSAGYGIICANKTLSIAPDINYKVLQTDIQGSEKAEGFLFNMNGYVVGIITNDNEATDVKNVINAYGISEMKKAIEKMSNCEPPAYIGIIGTDVSEEANITYGVPMGAYVQEVTLDSPSMLAGIQQGDVIVELGGYTVKSFSTYMMALAKLQPEDAVDIVIERPVQDAFKKMTLKIVLGKR